MHIQFRVDKSFFFISPRIPKADILAFANSLLGSLRHRLAEGFDVGCDVNFGGVDNFGVDILLSVDDNQNLSNEEVAAIITGFERNISPRLEVGKRYRIKIQREGKVFTGMAGTQIGLPAGLRRDA